MRKITLLFLLLTISFSVKAQFTEGFESGIPATWTVINNGSTNGWAQNTAPSGGALEGTAVAGILYGSAAHEDYLITPAIAVTTGTNEFLSFSMKSRSSSYLEPYEVLLSTTDTADTSFTVVLQASSDAPAAWTLNSFDLSSYNGQTVYVAIKATGTNEFELFVDDVFSGVQSNAPNCATDPTPADAATDVPYSGSVTIAWTAPATGDAPTGYEVFWGTTSGSLTSIGITPALTTNITGLDFSTTYYWMIVPQNNGGSATGCAEWSFTTEATPPAPANDLPAGAIALTLDEGTACGANTITGITNQSTTDSGVAAPMCGSYGTPTTQGDLWYTFVAPASGSLTLNTSNVTVISSVAGAFYSGTSGSLTEEGCTEFASGWPWLLSGLTAGDTYYLRLWDYGNDNIGTFDLCGYYSNCPVPTGVSVTTSAATEAVVSWTAGGSETNWTYEYGATGFTQGSGTSGMTTSSSIMLASLTAGADYDVYIQANCAGGGNSIWTTKVTWTQTFLANNTLAGAIPITPSAAGTGCTTAGFTLPFSTDGTTDSGMDGTCNTTNTGLDQFFTWTATTDGLTFNSDSPLMGNPGIIIRDPSGTQIACGGTYSANTVLSGWTIGDNLIIQIYDFGTSVSDVAFCLEEYTLPSPPANDDCAGAVSLTVNTDLMCTSVTSGTLVGATDSGVMDNGSGTPNDDVWYSFTATAVEHVIEIKNAAGSTTDLVNEVLSGACGTLTSVSVSDPDTNTVSSLTIGDVYYVRVFSWSGNSGATTTFDVCVGTPPPPPPPIVPTYSEDFTTYPADRWSEASGAFMMPTGTSSDFTSDDFGNDTGHANGKSARINIYGTGTDEYLISPEFNLSGATYFMNFDIAYTTFSGTTAATLGADDYVALIVTEDDGTTWTELTRWDSGSTISNTGEAVSEIMLTGYGADVQFAFYAFSDTSNVDNNFYIDNFQITTTTLKVESNGIENFSLFPTIVKDNLSFTSQENVDAITIYNIMGQEILSRKPAVTNASIDVSSLSSGMYIVKVKAGDSLGSYKIIKE